jgi:hypothetical protein
MTPVVRSPWSVEGARPSRWRRTPASGAPISPAFRITPSPL